MTKLRTFSGVNVDYLQAAILDFPMVTITVNVVNKSVSVYITQQKPHSGIKLW